jgi:hypothetical protein
LNVQLSAFGAMEDDLIDDSGFDLGDVQSGRDVEAPV